MAVTTVTTTMAGAINYTVVTDTSADWPSVANSIYFYDKATKLVYFKNSGGSVLEIFSAGGLTYFTEAQSTSAPNATVNVDSLTAVASTTNADAAIVPKGTGALLAAIPDNTTTGGNKRGTNSIDLQTTRTNADQVASGNCSVVIGSNSKASSNQGVAIGIGALASGTGVALNSNSNITGANATASGVGSFAVNGGLAQGNWSFAIGRSVASGLNSFAGAGYYGSNTASGSYGSLAIGEGNIASGQSSVALGSSHISSGFASVISGGSSNRATGTVSSVTGGFCNTSSSLYAAISGGFKNLSQGIAGFIGGGNCNNICNSTSGCLAFGAVVAGGVGNNTTGGTWTLASCAFTVAPTICNAGQYSTIVGGFQNIASSCYTTVGGGLTNCATQCYATVTGGICNRAIQCAFVGGGVCNSASGYGSVVAGGAGNNVPGQRSATLGGVGNTNSGNYSVITGSRNNTVVAGGFDNTISGSYNTITAITRGAIAGASGSTVSAQYGWVGGGRGNTASGTASIVSGGRNNTASALYATVMGGRGNISSGVDSGTLGRGNTASGIQSMAIGAFSVADSLFGFALGRDANVFSIIGRQTYASGSTSVIGDAQKSTFVLRAATTGVTPTALTSDGSGTALSTNQVILSNQSSYRFKGSIIGKQNGSTNIASWDVDGLIVRGANAAATTLNISNVNVVQNTPAWGTPTLAADTSNGGVRINVIGAAVTNIQWTAVIETTEVIYA